MRRAAVLIGVSKLTGYPVLQATEAGVRQMEEWARAQSFSVVKAITDATDPVQPQDVYAAIADIVKTAAFDQLIIYFTGHGLRNADREYWLFSEGPAFDAGGLNLAGSVSAAKTARIPHVVFISDACRTPVMTNDERKFLGSVVFSLPDDENYSFEPQVDVFYACRPGQATFEVGDKNQARKTYRALYTDVLAEALKGQHEDALERTDDGGVTVALVRPHGLKRFLERKVVDRYRALGAKKFPSPSADILSEPKPPRPWLSRFSDRPTELLLAGMPPSPAGQTTVASLANTSLDTVLGVPLSSVDSAVHEVVRPMLEKAVKADVQDADVLDRSISREMRNVEPTRLDMPSGFRIRGATIKDVLAVDGKAIHLSESLIGVETLQPATSVLLQTQRGTGVVLPAIRDFLCSLTFDNGRLVHVVWEPSIDSRRWPEFVSRHGLTGLRALRAIMAACAELGTLSVSRDDLEKVTSRMRFGESVDPSLAIYSGYANVHSREWLLMVERWLRQDLNCQLFDVSLLAGTLTGTQVGATDLVFPFVPMRSRGWAILEALRVRRPNMLADLARHVEPSLWTVFDREGVEKVRAAIRSGEVS